MKIQNNIIIKSANFNKTNSNKLIVFLHGYGSNGLDFEPIADLFSKKLTNTVVCVPDAPFECAMSHSGREWFPLSDNSLQEDIANGPALIEPFLTEYIHDLQAEYHCNEINLLGFSQGAILSLAMLYYMNISKIVAFSGLFHPQKNMDIVAPNAKILLVHGDEDDVVPYSNASLTMSSLQALKIQSQLITCKGVGHTISMQYIDQCIKFLKQ